MTRAEAVAKLSALGCELAEPQSVEEKAARRAAQEYRPRTFNPNSQCLRKIRYATKDEAVKRIRRVGNVYLSSYFCAFCRGWHNGNAPKGRV